MTNLSSSQSLPEHVQVPVAKIVSIDALLPGNDVAADPNATALKDLLATYLKPADIENVAAAYQMALRV